MPARGKRDPTQEALLGAVTRMPLEHLKKLAERLEDASHQTEVELLPNTDDRTVSRMSTLSTVRLLETEELGSDFTHHPDLQETTQVLNDYSTYLQHRRFPVKCAGPSVGTPRPFAPTLGDSVRDRS